MHFLPHKRVGAVCQISPLFSSVCTERPALFFFFVACPCVRGLMKLSKQISFPFMFKGNICRAVFPKSETCCKREQWWVHRLPKSWRMTSEQRPYYTWVLLPAREKEGGHHLWRDRVLRHQLCASTQKQGWGWRQKITFKLFTTLKIWKLNLWVIIKEWLWFKAPQAIWLLDSVQNSCVGEGESGSKPCSRWGGRKQDPEGLLCF